MSKKQKKILVLAGAFALAFGIVPNVSAMHIMEGYLPGSFCIAWGVLCVPFLIAGFMSIKKTLNEHRNLITMLAMSGAFIFVISSLKIPSVTGSCSHMTGTGLGQLALAHNADTTFGAALGKFMAIFAPTQVPLAIIEGIITVVIFMGLETYAKPELRAMGILKEAK